MKMMIPMEPFECSIDKYILGLYVKNHYGNVKNDTSFRGEETVKYHLSFSLKSDKSKIFGYFWVDRFHCSGMYMELITLTVMILKNVVPNTGAVKVICVIILALNDLLRVAPILESLKTIKEIILRFHKKIFLSN